MVQTFSDKLAGLEQELFQQVVSSLVFGSQSVSAARARRVSTREKLRVSSLVGVFACSRVLLVVLRLFELLEVLSRESCFFPW